MTSTGLSAGLSVNPNAIHSYADVVGRQETVLNQVHAALARIDLPPDAFGKMPEAGALHAAYTAHATDILAITARLPAQISCVSANLHSTAQSYARLESTMAADITELFGTGSGSSGNGAGGDIGVAATLTSKAKKYYSWVSAPETALPPLAPESAYGASSGLSGLLDGGINFIIDHIHPLLEMLDYVTGDSDALATAAAAWHDQGNALNNVIRELKTSASGLPNKWGGQACDQFGQFMGDVTTSLTEIVSVMGQTQKILDDAREQSEFAHDTIVMIIREVIEWFAGNAAIDLATMGAATIFEAAGTSLMLARKIEEAEQAESKLAGVYKALKKIIDALQEAKKAFSTTKGLGKLQKLWAMPKAFEKAFEAGSLKNLRFFSNGKVAGAAKLIYGAGRHAEGVPEALEFGAAGVLASVGVRAGVTMGVAATGVDSDPGLVGLGKGVIDGNLDNLSGSAEGAAETIGLGPSIPDAPSVQQVDATIKTPETSDGK